MLVKDIINNINKLLSNNTSFRLSYERLKFHLDSAIDNINRELLTNYPTIQEMYDSARGYYYMISLGYNVLLLHENNNYYLDESTGKLYYRDNTKDEFIYTVNTNTIDGLYNENNCSSYIIDNNNELYLSDGSELYTEDNHRLSVDYIYTELPKSDIPEVVNMDVNYIAIPDRYIRSCVVYGAVCNYLEEEDELENQYRIYKNKVEQEIDNWKKQYYSMYECRW